MKSYNLVLVGVGGQGILTLGTIIGVACTVRGLDASIAEVHGLSQRGGTVIVYVKIGSEPSPLIPLGGADHMISLELLETARYLPYMKKGGIVTTNDYVWPPPLSKYPSRDQIIEGLKSRDVKLYVVNANEISMKFLNSPISANVALLGVAMAVDPQLRDLLTIGAVEKALEEHFKGKVLELNKAVFKAAFEEGLKLAGMK
ncbi:MAG: indolepyruvate oxidoreductase subunit beta [Ignisphaera sp.]|nr:indolepyruvate oxidoreductase subunit beta [Ignisphaera sp.]